MIHQAFDNRYFYVLLALFIFYPIISGVFLWLNYDNLATKESRKLFGNLYTEISLRKGRLPLMEYQMNLVRRFLYIIIPAMFRDSAGP
jgi:hypothetical protein